MVNPLFLSPEYPPPTVSSMIEARCDMILSEAGSDNVEVERDNLEDPIRPSPSSMGPAAGPAHSSLHAPNRLSTDVRQQFCGQCKRYMFASDWTIMYNVTIRQS